MPSYGNALRITGPFRRESSGHMWIPLTKDRGLVFYLLLTWNPIAFIWRHRWYNSHAQMTKTPLQAVTRHRLCTHIESISNRRRSENHAWAIWKVVTSYVPCNKFWMLFNRCYWLIFMSSGLLSHCLSHFVIVGWITTGGDPPGCHTGHIFGGPYDIIDKTSCCWHSWAAIMTWKGNYIP